ncbi:peptidase S10 family protein [Sphingomonas changbaiensis NBRC 104936]|uniref:Peptidase S10 family protein n=1 Tax=Sphingomonas changbaiensis NBRC 104936 TaxID=1219043 RepID=A0A0E9MSF0_9SPHN|nr:peptidase S10 family protein [Sphingomonas changbaiensis NBRC 104936]
MRPYLLAAVALLAAPAFAQDKKADTRTEAPADIPPPQVVVTHHSGVFGGQKINYTATAGEIYLKAEDGTPRAAINYYSYVKEPRDPSRPVTFLFNGGPGSGSVWLHMGAFGPKRVAIPSDARDDGAPPYPLVDNPDCLLDVTDIVFIDPVGTGFSHALGKTDPKEFWGVTKDAKSINQVIRLWLNDNGRWNSPKFLGGESYGTTRSAAVAHELEGSYNDVALNGIILMSTILDFGAQAEVEGNDMPYIIALPSMAAVAWYHDKVPNKPATVAAFVAEAKAFASGEYATALMKGQALTGPERDAIRAKLARYTGLSEQYVERTDLRVSPGRFWKELLRDRGLVVGRLDSRYTGKDRDNAGEGFDNDPSFYGIDGGYTAAINTYVRGDLGFKSDRSYVTIGSVQPWDWDLGDRGGDGTYYKSVAPYLGQALRENSGLRIFVGQGYYDFATPFFGAEYALSRTGFPQDRIQFHYYDAGHMMYVRDEDRHKLASDIKAFIRSR